MVNETFDRIMLKKWNPMTGDAATIEVGIYSACYKLSILITLFVQAFRMGAEPFFFRQSLEQDAPKTYARVMKFFVIVICVMFLLVALYLDIWKQLFLRDTRMWVGLKVVPILLFANMFLGIYINLSIWYRLSHKTTAGAYITLIGVFITLVVNYIFIPYYSYMACAWATFLCYGTMMVVSYKWGQKSYRIPYATKKTGGLPGNSSPDLFYSSFYYSCVAQWSFQFCIGDYINGCFYSICYKGRKKGIS